VVGPKMKTDFGKYFLVSLVGSAIAASSQMKTVLNKNLEGHILWWRPKMKTVSAKYLEGRILWWG